MRDVVDTITRRVGLGERRGVCPSNLTAVTSDARQDVEISVVLPCLNEAETVGTCVNKARAWLARSGRVGEILVADNGSTDGSQQAALEQGARVIDVPARGYGSALTQGSKAATGRYIVIGDADDSYDFSNLDAFVTELDAGAALVMGNRFKGGIEAGAMPWKNRYIGNPVLSRVGRLLFRTGIGDFHCGLRAYTREAFDRMDLRTTGMEYASEMVIKAHLLGLPIAEVPTTLSKDGRSRPPHLRPWRDGWRHLRFMLLMSPRWLFLIPGAFLTLVSLVAYVRLLTGPLRVGHVVFDVRTTFVVETALVLGYSTMTLGAIVRLFAVREGLLKGHRLLERMRQSPILELGSLAGVVLILAGVYLGVVLVAKWGSTDFGELRTPGRYLRSISLATFLLTTGGLTVLFSLIMGFLALPTRSNPLE